MPRGWETLKEELSSQINPKKKTIFIPTLMSAYHFKMYH
jgi:hypothetical protein